MLNCRYATTDRNTKLTVINPRLHVSLLPMSRPDMCNCIFLLSLARIVHQQSNA